MIETPLIRLVCASSNPQLHPFPAAMYCCHSACLQVRLLFEVNSPYVVQYYDSFIDEGKLNIVMEYCDST